MSLMQSEVFEAFRAIDIPEDKALKAATALSKRDDDVSSLKSELLVLKWMMGFVLAFQIAIFAKLFLH
ncbi:MAG: integrase [Beijerinckiaceae bacterium]|nr:integrase [Beijerinckiaceae bacterium]